MTGEGKTEAVLNALKLYRDRQLSVAGLDERLEEIRQKVHARIDAAHIGRAPSKSEIENELGMP